MKMPNKHSAPSGRRPTLRMADGGVMNPIERQNAETSASSIVRDGNWAAANQMLAAQPARALNPVEQQNALTSASSITRGGGAGSPFYSARGQTSDMLSPGMFKQAVPQPAPPQPAPRRPQPPAFQTDDGQPSEFRQSLRMQNGGIAIPTVGPSMGDRAWQMVDTGLRGAARAVPGVSRYIDPPIDNATNVAAIGRMMAPPTADQIPQPRVAPAPANPDNPAGIQFKHGGSASIDRGMGGHVPGQGEGDKIPAKYEPGEFVVSNDMLEAEPALRKHLSLLREEVLAAKGMTPEEADAKALNGGKGLRANDGLLPFPRLTDETGRPVISDAEIKYESAADADARVRNAGATTGEFATEGKPRAPQDNMASAERTAAPKAAPKSPIPEVSPIPKGQGPQTGVPLAARQAAWNAQDAAASSSAKPQTLADRINARNTLSESRIAQKIGGVKDIGSAVTGRLRAAGDVLEAVGNNPYVKVAGAAYGGYQAKQEGGKTMDALEQGDGAGAIKHGALTLANAAQVAPLLGRAALGAAGTGYAIGDAVGSWADRRADAGKSTLGYDAAAKDALGGTINKVVGGAEDTSVRAKALIEKYGAMNVPQAEIDALYKTPKSAPAAAGAATKAAEPSFEAKNAAMIAAKDAADNAPGQIGEERNFDRDGNMLGEGLAQVWTGPKMGWQTQTSAAGKQANALRDQQYEARMARNADAAINGPTSYRAQLRNMQNMNADTLESQLMRGEITDPRAAKAIESNAARRSTLRQQEVQSEGQVRSAEIQANGSRSSARITAEAAARNAEYERMEKDRRYKLDVQKFGVESADKLRDDRRVSAEAFDKRVLGLAGTTPDGKPNEQAASKIRTLANAFLSQKQAEATELLKKDPNNAKARTLLAAIEKDGPGAIDEETMREILVNYQASNVAKEYDGWKINPWAGRAKETTAPVTSLKLQDNFLMPNQYATETGELIPQRAVERNPDLRALIRQ